MTLGTYIGMPQAEIDEELASLARVCAEQEKAGGTYDSDGCPGWSPEPTEEHMRSARALLGRELTDAEACTFENAYSDNII